MKKNIVLLFILIFTYSQVWSQINLNTPDPIQWNATYELIEEDTYVLAFTADIDEGWYLYGQDHNNHFETKFVFDGSDDHSVIGNPGLLDEFGKVIKGYDETLQSQYTKYANKVVFKQTIKVIQDETKIVGRVQYMTCDDTQCIPPTEQTFETLTIYRKYENDDDLLLGSGIDMKQLEQSQKGSKKELTADRILEVWKGNGKKVKKSPRPTVQPTKPALHVTPTPVSEVLKPVPVPVSQTQPTSEKESIPTTIEPTTPVSSTTIEPTTPISSTIIEPTIPVSSIIVETEVEESIDDLVLEGAAIEQTSTPISRPTPDQQENPSYLDPPLVFDKDGNSIPDGAIIHGLDDEVTEQTKPEPKQPVKKKQEVSKQKVSKQKTTKKVASEKKTQKVNKENATTKKEKVSEVTANQPTKDKVLANTIKQIPNRSANNKSKLTNSSIVKPIDWKFELKHVANDIYEIRGAAMIDAGWHLYAMDNINQGNGPYPLTFQFDKNAPLTFVDQQFKVEGQLEESHDVVFNQTAKRYTNQVVLTRKVKLATNQAINGSVKFMAANHTNYLMPKKKQFSLQVPPKKVINNASFVQTASKNYKWFILAGMLLSTLGLGYMVYLYKKTETIG